MDTQGYPKHQLLKDEVETDIGSQYSQSLNIDSKNQIKGGQEETQGQNLGDNKDQKKDDNQLILTIKKLSGEPINIPYTDNLKQMNILGLKQLAFPEQFANGYSIRFIYRGRLVNDQEVLGNLEFIGHPVIHAQINPPLVPPGQQQNVQNAAQQGGDVENQQNQFQGVIPPNQYNNFQALAAQMLQQQAQNVAQQQPIVNQNPYEVEGTTCDFWFGLFLVLFMDFVGLFIVFCCQYPKKTKRGAIIGFCLRIIIKIIFYQEEELAESQY